MPLTFAPHLSFSRIKLHLLLLCGVLPFSSLHAQQIFVLMDHGVPKPVKAVYNNLTQVEENGKLVSKAGEAYAFRKAAIYGQGYVELQEFKVIPFEDGADDAGTLITHRMEVDGLIKSETALTNCFMVLELQSPAGTRVTYLELPDFKAGETRSVHVRPRTDTDVGHDPYVVHVFSNGVEIINSTFHLSPEEIAAQHKKTETFYATRNQADHDVVLLEHPAPVYPEELKEQRLTGTAKIRCHITENGEVSNVEVVEASHPAFGREAAKAIANWKFQPAVKDHHVIEKKVVVPFNFAPPPAAAPKESSSEAGKP